MRTRASWATLIAVVLVFCSIAAVRADVPANTDVFATLQDTLDTRTAKAGDAVVMTVTGVLPADAPDAHALQGATIRGHVQQAYAATPTKKAYIGILFDTVTLTDGRTFPYPAKVVALQKKRSINAVQAAGEVLAGMVVGNMLFKTMGSSAGGPLGAVGGAVYASQMAQNFKIPSSSTVKMRTTDVIATVPHPQAPAGAMQPPPPPMAPPPSPMPTH
jgi:cell division septation protein DedD